MIGSEFVIAADSSTVSGKQFGKKPEKKSGRVQHPYLSFGQYMQQKHGERVHKLSINASFTCPNRDGTKGIGGCTFCNISSFSPNAKAPDSIETQIAQGKAVIVRRTGAKKYLAYFQAYTNTYDDAAKLKLLYDRALAVEDVIGLSIGTRPDCVPDEVLDLLVSYQNQGYDIWLELGLQSAFDASLARVNRGHGWAEYEDACSRARHRGLKVCTHLIVGLPGEATSDSFASLDRVLNLGTDGIKFHPLHIVKGTQLAREWKRGEYQPVALDEYIKTVVKLVRMLPKNVVVHRLIGTASEDILLAPAWCSKKWSVLNEISRQLKVS
jgi:radical SAM protein (TIGR01212 family)